MQRFLWQYSRCWRTTSLSTHPSCCSVQAYSWALQPPSKILGFLPYPKTSIPSLLVCTALGCQCARSQPSPYSTVMVNTRMGLPSSATVTEPWLGWKDGCRKMASPQEGLDTRICSGPGPQCCCMESMKWAPHLGDGEDA